MWYHCKVKGLLRWPAAMHLPVLFPYPDAMCFPRLYSQGSKQFYRRFNRLKNSSLVFARDLIAPSIQLVVVIEPDF